MALEKELETYRQLVGDRDRANEHVGQHVLINGDQICGFYSSFDDALQDGYKQFEPERAMTGQFALLCHLLTPASRHPLSCLLWV